MSKGHTAVNEFLEKKDRFADFFNGNFFQGEQIVRPEELEIVKGESDILVEDKEQNVKNIHRYRDIVMRWKGEIYFAILACETQSAIHYAMPVRGMLYDGLSYLEQIKNIWESHQENKKEKVSGAEYLSKFRKEDKLIPIISAVFYYGTESWDGSTDLHGMFQDDALIENKIVQKYIPNYKINLIDADGIEDVNRFQTDLRQIFGMMKHRRDKEELKTYMNRHGEYFRKLDGGTYQVVAEILQSKRMLKKMAAREEREGEFNMCKALEDLYQDGVEVGIKALVETMQELGSTIESVVSKVVEKFEMTQEIAEGHVGRYWKQ